ncbi:MAG: ImmA/IrrE family metallo-endopeptidase [Candidatus Moranbacteria bacterium]|nr:ImmA/IrrE family metallo-endopeptidase [Candidatus Moranbacteria bacterium]
MEALNKLIQPLKDKYLNVIPLPVIALAKDLGLQVFESKDLLDFESGTIRKENQKYIIYVNANHSPPRQRYTIAHEIGLFLMFDYKIQEKIDISKNLEAAVAPFDTKGNVDERFLEAYKFAMDILLPEYTFLEKWHSSRTLDEIARFFAVPKEIVALRANSLLTGNRKG